MSQAIRKLKEGDKAPQVNQKKLFKDGNRNIDLDLIQKNANYNVQNYLDSRGWNRKKKQAFMDAYSDMMSSINNGSIAERDSGRKYIDSTGRISNSQGRGFDAYGEAAHFIDSIVDALPDYQQETPQKSKYDPSGLMILFRNRTFGGNQPDMEIWQNRDVLDEATGKRDTKNRAEYFAQILDDYAGSLNDSDYDFEGSAYANKEDLITRLQQAATNLRDGTFDNNDYAALTSIGISGDEARALFNTGTLEEKKPEDSELAVAQKTIEEDQQRQQREEYLEQARQIQLRDALKQELTSRYITPAQGYQRRETYLPRPNYNRDTWTTDLGTYKGGAEGYYNNFQKLFTTYDIFNPNLRVSNGMYEGVVPLQTHIANNLDYLGGRMGDDIGDGYYYLPYSFDEKTATAVIYNPTTGHVVRDAVTKFPKVWEKIQNDALAQRQGTQFNFQNGGILSFQQGGYFTGRLNNWHQDQLKAIQQTKEESTQKKAKDKGITVKAQKDRSREVSDFSDLTATDIARIGAAAADVASIASAFVPVYGTAVGAVTGLASTAATAFADIKEDGFDWGDAKNIGANLMMDVIGLIPGFGAASKTSKIVKNLVRYVPRLIAFATASNMAPEVIKSIGKIGTDEKFTADDWRNIANGLMAFSTATKAGRAAMKARAYKNATKTGDYTITNKSGKQLRVTPEQLEKIKGAKNLEEANKVLKSIKGYENEELASHFKHGIGNVTRLWNNNPIVRDHYDFSGAFTDRKGRDVNFTPKNWKDYFRDDVIYSRAVNGRVGFGNGIHFNFGLKNPYRISRKTPESTKPQKPTESKQWHVGLPSPRRVRLEQKGMSNEELNNRGIYKQGGIIKAQDGTTLYNQNRYGNGFLSDYKHLIAGPVTAATVNGQKNTYGKVNKGAGYTFDTSKRIATALDLLGQGKATLDDINMMQRRHAGLYAGYNPSLSPIENALVRQYQTDYNSLGLNDSVIAPGYDVNYQRQSKNPTSGDNAGRNWTADGRYDQITDDRRVLARKEDYLNADGSLNQERLNADVAAARAKGYDYYLDTDSNYYMLRKSPAATPLESKPAVSLSTSTTTELPNKIEAPGTKTSQTLGTQSGDQKGVKNWLNALYNYTPDFIAAGRLAGNIMNNNRVAKETIKGLRPLLRDTYNLQRQVVGDLATKQNYYTQAAQLDSLAARPMTSDASLQLAGQLDARLKGDQLRTQGDLADNEAIRRTAEQAWQVQADNTARRSEVANQNRASILGIQKAKHDVEAARKSANWQSLENFLKEKEYRFRAGQDRQRQFNLDVAQQQLQQLYDNPRLQQLDRKLRAAAAKDPNVDITTLPEYDQYIKMQNDISRQYADQYNQAYANIYGLRYTPKRTYTPYISYKKGGVVEAAKIRARTENARLFQENIKESVKNHKDMINNLSSVTKELIIKSMTL